MIKDFIEDFFLNREVMRDVLKSVLTSTEISLEEKWEIFILSKDILPICNDDCVMHIITDTVYDDFYVERYETTSFVSIDEQILNYNNPKWNGKHKEWREAVLASGYSGFTNDW